VIGRSARVAPSVVAFVAVAVLAAPAILIAGCSPTQAPSNAAASATGSLAPAFTAEGPSSSAGAESPPRSDPASPGVGAAAQVDPGLLAFVPSTVEGVPLTFDAETSAMIAADPAIARDAASLAVALAIIPAASGVDDFAIVNVIRLRDPSKDEAWFRDWRDSYDEGACSQADGVAVGHAEAEIGGGTVYIGSCAGGVLTYHTRLEQAGILVSVHALGSRRLGEKVMAGIHR
jgi:hypothetical protein